jgi:hypothetical protein
VPVYNVRFKLEKSAFSPSILSSVSHELLKTNSYYLTKIVLTFRNLASYI